MPGFGGFLHFPKRPGAVASPYSASTLLSPSRPRTTGLTKIPVDATLYLYLLLYVSLNESIATSCTSLIHPQHSLLPVCSVPASMAGFGWQFQQRYIAFEAAHQDLALPSHLALPPQTSLASGITHGPYRTRVPPHVSCV